MNDEIRTAPAGPSSPLPASSAVRWTGPEIIVAFVLALGCQSLAYLALEGTGWFGWYYGDALRGAPEKLAAQRMGLWVGAVASALQVGAILVWFRSTSGVRPAELGLTTQRLGRNVAAGLLFAVIFAPGAYAIQWLAIQGMRQLGVEEEAHPFTQMGKGALFPAEWAVLIASAVVLAPVWEELLYRGVVQPWVMSRQPMGGPAALAGALAMALSMRAEPFRAAVDKGGGALLVELVPFACLLAMLPVYALANRKSPEWGGLFASAVLFGWIHARVWPSPLALVWLALGLGWLRWKAGSLAGCVVLHAAFNAIACAMLLASLWGR
jgi:membrane protease YdiL (CAAX protease family)